MRILLALLLVLVIVPGWSGEERLALLNDHAQMTVAPVALDPRDPAVKQVGALTYLGGVSLHSRDPAFGGFSAMTLVGDRFTLLSDGGNVVRFRMGADWQPYGLHFSYLPDGPGSGWEKRDRDSESMAIDPATGRIWVGFERVNQIWRYAAGFARVEGRVAPAAMKRWPDNGGAESLARMPDGRFVTISESTKVPAPHWRGPEALRRQSRIGVIFAGDPLTAKARRFGYIIEGRYDVADAVALPGGDLLVLERSFSLPFRFANRIVRVAARDVASGKVARGRLLATLAAPLIHDNFEGMAVAWEGGRTILWLVSDDNQFPLQRSLLLKFALKG
ncbi:esterase-like activity of phytase family protein [uncultured Sphingomonas sp.]|uniref:esterase-like activity of phytase family protein n=1 Tax=uncultured Sphingomonas sp. TaxID=158754 RepID=UPI00261CA79C|nr:esterase-like activity of phytase family protein [uncultured Sphingomonas sp.]